MSHVPNSRHEEYSRNNGFDFYPTPAPFTNVLLDFYQGSGRIHDCVWEPACGDGSMSKAISSKGYVVHSSNLVDQGYGSFPIDFLTAGLPEGCKSIITNGPFKLAEQFVKRAWHWMDTGKVDLFAILLPAHWFGSEERYRTIFSVRRPQQLIVISDRMSGRYNNPHYDKKGRPVLKWSSNFNHCWFIWDGNLANSGQTLMDWRISKGQ